MRASPEPGPDPIDVGRYTPGRWVEALAVGHAVVGVVLHRRALRDIARRRVFAAVPDRGDRATAFWFMVVAPALWTAGRLLRAAETAGDGDAQRSAGIALAATGVAGGVALPASPFWALAVIGAAAVRRARSNG